MANTKEYALSKDLTWVGVLDKELEVFDIIMRTEFGTTYNAYALNCGGATVLFETVKAAFFDEYAEKLSKVADINAIDYLVLSHTEPDHAGSVERLLELNPGLKIISTPGAATFLKHIVNRRFFSMAVKDGQEMTIGNKTMTFLHAPFLHWPDTMYTYISEEKALVTCDSFGSHYAFEGVVTSKLTEAQKPDYWKATRYYYDCIMGPFKPYVLSALEKIKPYDVSLILTGHGPVLDGGLDEMFAAYREWSTVVNPNKRKTVIIPYVSAYGYTAALSERVAAGVMESGGIDVRRYDMVTADKAKVAEECAFADGLLFGTPTILSEALEPIWEITTSMYPVTHGGKLASAFGSYGWSGEGVPHIIERLKQLKMNVLDGFRVRFKPNDEQLSDAFDFGYNFGCVLLDKENTKKKKSARKTLVKCLVCGEIFDSSMETCPVCGVGKENFIAVEGDYTGFANNSNNRYVILGGGAAAWNAANAIRERDKTGSIVIVSNESSPPYNRPMLTKSLLTGLSPWQIVIRDSVWYRENNIELKLNETVKSIDAANKSVALESGENLNYDKLIYALGAECFIPPIKGADKQGVIAIRRASDTEKLFGVLKAAKTAVVIGGGVLGLEVACELRRARLNVTVLEGAPTLMGRQLDDETSAALRALAESKNVKVVTGVTIESVDGGEKAASVTASGVTYPADVVVVSTGARANVTVAQAAGISAERGVAVDKSMRTNVTDIYACGDCAVFGGVNFQLWAEAAEQGRVAGANAAGDDIDYENIDGAVTFNGFDSALYAVGDLGKVGEVKYKTVAVREAGRFEKLFFANGRLTGASLVGDTSNMAELTEAVAEGKPFREVAL